MKRFALLISSAVPVLFGFTTLPVYSSSPQQAVVQIENQAEPGSGFFLKVGSQVIFITAKHVVGASGEAVQIRLPNGETLTVPLKDQVPIAGIDAAVLLINDTPQSIKPLLSSSSNLDDGQPLTVWGFPVRSTSTTSTLTNRTGAYKGQPSSIEDGYSILYGAETQIGFSGGPILDESGLVVGMHGRSESRTSANGTSIRTGNALGIAIKSILTAISSNGNNSSIDRAQLAAQAVRASMKKVYDIITGSALSDQVLSELNRASEAGAPKYCVEMGRAYYYTFFSQVPDLSRANSSLTIQTRADRVPPSYYAFASLVSRKSADFKKALIYNRILEQTGNSSYLQYSERRLQDDVQSSLGSCSNL